MLTATLSPESDRRKHPRHRVVRLCKVRDRRSLLFSPGQTCDISVGGAMLRVDRTRPFAEGDEIDMIIAWGNDAVLTGDAIVRGVVRRVTPIDHHHQSVAVAFEALPALRQPVTTLAA
ncbi:MAG TPA: hypothetical protein DEB06_08165 [Phycisphaerales bacterium]|nr:hypothetical protein [Phycisphaerales bacterium]